MGPPDVVKKYLRDQNRPYSANDIFMNLHKEIGKTAVQKALDQLVEKSDIIEKTYGKQKVYVIKQEDTTGDFGQELNDLDSKISDITEKLSKVEEQMKILESQHRELQGTPTTEEANREFVMLEERINILNEKLNNLSKNTVKIPPGDKEKIKKKYDDNMKTWRKRKRQCMDIVDSILEGYPKDKKTLLEEVGIETDEASNVSII